MKVVCTSDEWFPMAELENDRDMVSHCLTTPISLSKRESQASMGPEYVIEVTQKEFNKYYRLMSEVRAMSAMFLDRREWRKSNLMGGMIDRQI